MKGPPPPPPRCGSRICVRGAKRDFADIAQRCHKFGLQNLLSGGGGGRLPAYIRTCPHLPEIIRAIWQKSHDFVK